MTQTVQYDKNPSAEGSAVRIARASATPSLATDAFTAWPPLGTKSHKLVATAATIATVGLPNTDRPAAAAGEAWSAVASVRNSSPGSREIAVSIVFYNTAGSTLGTALATVSNTKTLAAGEISSFGIDGAVAPAGTASVDVAVSRTASGSPATSDAVHFDMVSLTKTASRVAYRDPTSTVLSTWSSTADASTQIYWDPTITLTPLADETPCPRMRVLIDDLPSGVKTLTLTRTAEGRSNKVRGAVAIPVASGFQTLDTECEFNVPASYRAEMFTAAGLSAGFTASFAATLTSAKTWVHNPLKPQGAVAIDIADTSGRELVRPINGDRFYPEQRVLAMFVTGRRLGLQGVELFFSTDDASVASKFEAMFGGYNDDEQTVPVLCVRTPAFLDIPRTFFAGILSPRKRPINVHMGGNLREWDTSADEAAPPFPGIIVPLLTRNDIDAAFATRNAMDAAYGSRLALDRDFSKAGTAP